MVESLIIFCASTIFKHSSCKKYYKLYCKSCKHGKIRYLCNAMGTKPDQMGIWKIHNDAAWQGVLVSSYAMVGQWYTLAWLQYFSENFRLSNTNSDIFLNCPFFHFKNIKISFKLGSWSHQYLTIFACSMLKQTIWPWNHMYIPRKRLIQWIDWKCLAW